MFTTRVRIAGLAAIAAGTLLLSGCTGDGPATSPEPTLTLEGPTSAPSPTPLPSVDLPTIGNPDDPLCAAARENLELSADVVAKSDELQELLQDPSFLTSSDPELLNAWGADMVELAENSLAFYEVGVAETQGEPINDDFVAMQGFITDYSAPLAQLAADAESPSVFMVQASTIVMQPETREVISAAPAAAKRIAEYIAERCVTVTS